jgi:uncharacterized membrane protein YcaP (DUF421 family)
MNAFDLIVTISVGSIFGRAIVTPAVSLTQMFVGLAVLVAMQAIVAALSVRDALRRRQLP